MDIKGLTYNPDTGEFFWTQPRKGVTVGSAGTKNTKGYLVVRIEGKLHYCHRLAFYFMTGKFPQLMVDHINSNREDNRWSNLREVTPSQNNSNRKRGDIPLGIYEIVRKGREGVWYTARIQKHSKCKSSTFRKLEDAIAWRMKKEEELFGPFRYTQAL